MATPLVMAASAQRHRRSIHWPAAACDAPTLADDIGEKNDLAKSKPDLVGQMHQAWLDWKAPFPPRAIQQAAKPGPNKPAPDRAALFEMNDGNHDGKLSLLEFIANQAAPDAAKKRIGQWDTDKDGSLTREEFVTMGKSR